jgi:hypothetical protein
MTDRVPLESVSSPPGRACRKEDRVCVHISSASTKRKLVNQSITPTNFSRSLTLLRIPAMLTLLGKLRVHTPQRSQERDWGNRLGRLVHPNKQISQIGGDPDMRASGTHRADHGVGLTRSVGRQYGLEFGNCSQGLERGVHIASVSKVSETGRLLEL